MHRQRARERLSRRGRAARRRRGAPGADHLRRRRLRARHRPAFVERSPGAASGLAPPACFFVAPRLRFVAAALAALLGAANPAFAQSYPEKPVRMLAPPPGGSTDFTSRLLAEAIAPGLGQRLLVDTRA